MPNIKVFEEQLDLNTKEQNLAIDIIIICNDLGGANVIYPIFELLRAKLKIKVICSDISKKVFKHFDGIISINESLFSTSLILNQLKPKLLLTGTSEYSNLERYFWKTAKDLNITTIAIIDSWTNMKERFTYFSIDKNDEKFQQPDIICLPDNSIKEQIIREGWCTSDLRVCGQAYLEKEISFLTQLRNEKNIAIGELVFISEPVIEKRNIRSIGYSQFSVANQLVEQLLGQMITRIVIKPHPKENKDNWHKWKKSWPKEVQKHIVISDSETEDLMSSSEFIVGMASMSLIVAALSGAITIALQPHRKYIPNIFVDKCDQINLLTHTENLSKDFEELKDKDIVPFNMYNSPFYNSIGRTSELILKYV
jgi:hypothetical protein